MYSERKVPMRVMMQPIQMIKIQRIAPVAEKAISKTSKLFTPLHHLYYHRPSRCLSKNGNFFPRLVIIAQAADASFPFRIRHTYRIATKPSQAACRIIQPGGRK